LVETRRGPGLRWGFAVPTVATSHFVLDVPTLFAVTVFISLCGGVLLLFSWIQSRSTPALALWGIGYLLAAAAATVLSSHLIPVACAVCLGNALMCAAYGMMWSGSRSFEGRRVHLPLSAAGAAIWIAAFQFDGMAQSPTLCMAFTAVIAAAYALLSGRELWYARDRELFWRWPTLLVIFTHAGFLLARIPLADALTSAIVAGKPASALVTVMAFESMLAVFCVPFLRVAMSKERAELEQRRAALTDALTSIANRRAFFDCGGPLLERTVADRRPAALLLFDLDRFKAINDTGGHQTGDRVLKAFCDLVTASIRPDDLFARIGGEEFACLLPDISMAEALQRAEQLRRGFEVMRFAGLTVGHTVSVGVAVTEGGRDLPALLATADRALYRAKADGRNRVAPAPLVLVERGGGEAVRRAPEIARPAVVVAPLAG